MDMRGQNGDIVLKDHSKLIIQVESLWRLKMCNKNGARTLPRLLILDECESIFSQFGASTVKKLTECFATFEYAVKHSTQVICMDAFLSDRTVNIIGSLRLETPFLHWNKYANATADKYLLCDEKETLTDSLWKDLKEGHRVAIATNNKKWARAIASRIGEEFPALKVIVYSAAKGSEEAAMQQEHFSNVDLYWAQYDVILYTPTVEAGISFEVQNHFQIIYGYFSARANTVESIMQMLGRVRDVGTRTYKIALESEPQSLPTESTEIEKMLRDSRRDLLLGGRAIPQCIPVNINEFDPVCYDYPYKGGYYCMWVENLQKINVTKTALEPTFINYVKSIRALIEIIRKLSFGQCADIKERKKVVAKAIDEADAELVANAFDLSNEQAEELEKKDNLTVAETDSLHKNFLRNHYNYHGEIDANWVGQWGGKRIIRQFGNLRALLRYPTDKVALKALKRNDKFTYEMLVACENPEAHDLSHKYQYNKHWLALELMH